MSAHTCTGTPPWADDPILLPLLRRTPNLHTYNAEGSISSSSNDRDAGAKSWGAVLLLDSVATSQVITSPDLYPLPGSSVHAYVPVLWLAVHPSMPSCPPESSSPKDHQKFFGPA
eukprot:1148682-Pelagomonas_calceolata.AAC.4